MRTSKPVLLIAFTALLASVLVSVVTGPAQASGHYVVTAVASATNAEVGRPLTFHGRVTPNAKGKKVALQVLQPGATHWATLKSVKLDKHSKYLVTVKPTVAGAASYRVVKAAGAGHGAGVSALRAVTTWRWRTLASLPRADGPVSGTTYASSVVLHGITFAPAIIQQNDPTDANAFYALGGKCSRFDAWVSGGPTSPNADNNSFASIWGSVAATPDSYELSIAKNWVSRGGDPVHVVRGPDVMSQVINLNLYASDLENVDTVAWGNPRVYCTS